MNILLISQCQKRALIETRRILDQFAERKGDRSWQTPITQAGLDTLRTLLKKTARKNTAVACHWIRSANHTELLWIVGNAGLFNEHGSVPTNITERNVLRANDENAWHTQHLINMAAQMAALWHDFGKASALFQAKLKSNARIADPYRHEWVSVRLLQAFVGQDDDISWLTKLSQIDVSYQWSGLIKDGVDASANADKPFAKLAPFAKLVAWLVLSHHRLPLPSGTDAVIDHVWQYLDADWAHSNKDAQAKAADCWRFDHGLPNLSETWRGKVKLLCDRLLINKKQLAALNLGNPFLAHLARLALIAADHHYSSVDGIRDWGDRSYAAFANTRADGALKQRLDEHLCGVAHWAKKLAGLYSELTNSFAKLRHAAFRVPAGPVYAWQNQAFYLAEAVRARAAQHGFFGVNMASTGKGKTLANARIMYGLANQTHGARFVIALGLRTLTLQTGDALAERLALTPNDLAVMIGSSAVRALHQSKVAESKQQLHKLEQQQLEKPEVFGSESAESLLEPGISVRFDGSLASGAWGEVLAKNPHALRLLSAPVLVCTVDHLMPASECIRGGHHIAPMLRLLTSDLVLDEPDDFDLNDLPALTRLVYFAGLLGSKVLLSSATLPPALIQGLFEAYRSGRAQFEANVGAMQRKAGVICAWFDEFATQHAACANEELFRAQHDSYVQQRLAKLATASQEQRRIAKIMQFDKAISGTSKIATIIAKDCLCWSSKLHQHHHSIDTGTGKKVSFGLLRMANIAPIIAVAKALLALDAPADTELHLCVYHSRFPLFVRSSIERTLDAVLKRHQEQAVFAHPEIRHALDNSSATNHIFLVLASPVAEVGRDHDYDWAIVEPSSVRSIIQLAGRVRRHRPGAVLEANIYLWEQNFKALKERKNGIAVFAKPGFETEKAIGPNRPYLLTSKKLSEILPESDFTPLNARPRLQERTANPSGKLLDLEHARLHALMFVTGNEYSVRSFWQHLENGRHYTAYDQEVKSFRDGEAQIEFYVFPNEGELEHWRLEYPASDVPSNSTFDNKIALSFGQRMHTWGQPDWQAEFIELATLESDERSRAHKFGVLQIPKSAEAQGMYWHELLGYSDKLEGG